MQNLLSLMTKVQEFKISQDMGASAQLITKEPSLSALEIMDYHYLLWTIIEHSAGKHDYLN